MEMLWSQRLVSCRKLLKKDWICHFLEAADSLRTAMRKQWSVPWSADTILQVMVLWISSFWFVGSWVIGFNKESLTYRWQALYSLLTDVTEGIAGLAVLGCLVQFYPLPKDWFRFSLKGNWHVGVALGCLMFPPALAVQP